jgi:hypothetical protein
MAADLVEIQTDLGNPVFGYKTASNIPCTPNNYSVRKSVNIGGITAMADLILLVLKSNLVATGIPNNSGKEKVTYKGRTWRVDHVITAPTDIYVRLVCINASNV